MADGDVSGDVDAAAQEPDTDRDAPAAVAMSKTDRMRGGPVRRFFSTAGYYLYETPAFAFLLVLFILVKVSVNDMRAVLLSVGAYEITWVEMMYALAAFIALGEIYKISEPGERNTKEAILIAVAAVVYMLLFTLGAAQVPAFAYLFSNSEFLIMTAIGVAGAIIALIINPRTAQRTFTGGGGD